MDETAEDGDLRDNDPASTLQRPLLFCSHRSSSWLGETDATALRLDDVLFLSLSAGSKKLLLITKSTLSCRETMR
jgi:hypothetical protein